MKHPDNTPKLVHHKEVWLTHTAHRIAKAAAAAHDLPVAEWLSAAIANQAESEGLDLESVLDIEEELQ